MVALSWAGAEPGKFQKAPLLAGWLLIPFFFSLARTKIRHHRQRNRELSAYIMFLEMLAYGKFNGKPHPGLNIFIGIKGNERQYVQLSKSDVGWEHFIRSKRHILPRIVDELEKEEERSKELARDCRLEKPIESMSRIELWYMNVFLGFALAVSAFQIGHILVQIAQILTGIDMWDLVQTNLSKLLVLR